MGARSENDIIFELDQDLLNDIMIASLSNYQKPDQI